MSVYVLVLIKRHLLCMAQYGLQTGRYLSYSDFIKVLTPWYSWNIAESGVKTPKINQSIIWKFSNWEEL